MSIFIKNKYTKIYEKLISKAKERNLKKYRKSHPKYRYTETHHIIPRSLGGHDVKDNRVILLPKEHYICHRLLTKITNGANRNTMIRAMFAIIDFNNQYQKDNRYFPCSRIYQKLRLDYSNAIRGRIGPRKGIPMSESSKKKQSESTE